jgi:hypothetical protein
VLETSQNERLQTLSRDAVDLSWSSERQISTFLDAAAPYVDLLRHGRYEGMLVRDQVERLMLRQLLMQPQAAR